ncbi:hypothetical protein PCASD_04009 [Puccinia coronata f. sp. avenae]|uniref:Secreted protein n=1 Tax=Puccinia coronata f. sp. avenae TaxID=200324 RepID=A0A2N5V5F8_9BASI|nr:hypothetical protein PCASD_12209 [Puccinia coronata f. sp. avenae]PLW45218.1 hypothetical protein PCASD_04009 [Puccinia coronata f. sp. avenae]
MKLFSYTAVLVPFLLAEKLMAQDPQKCTGITSLVCYSQSEYNKSLSNLSQNVNVYPRTGSSCQETLKSKYRIPDGVGSCCPSSGSTMTASQIYSGCVNP